MWVSIISAAHIKYYKILLLSVMLHIGNTEHGFFKQKRSGGAGMEKYGSKKRYITSRRGIKKQPEKTCIFLFI